MPGTGHIIQHMRTEPAKNKLLRRLPPDEWDNVRRYLELKDMPIRTGVYEPYTAIEHIYFPESGVLSLVAEVEDGKMIEVATVGNEGFVGVPVLHGATSIPGRAFSQISGQSLFMSALEFRSCLKELQQFNSLMNRYAEALFNQIAQSAACNRAHNIEKRCARWLLLSHDRMERQSFPLTQEFLGQMLGVARSAVNIAAGELQQAGLITYARGVITVEDRAGLEAASCICYKIISKAFED